MINSLPNFQKPRLRVRKIDESFIITNAIKDSKRKNIPVIHVRHGGTVANKYGYPAETECLMVVAFPCGDYCAYSSRIPANKATYSGVARACYGEDAKYIFDNRVSDEKSRKYFWKIVNDVWKEVIENKQVK